MSVISLVFPLGFGKLGKGWGTERAYKFPEGRKMCCGRINGHLSNKYLLTTFYVPYTLLGTEDIKMSHTWYPEHAHSCLHGKG